MLGASDSLLSLFSFLNIILPVDNFQCIITITPRQLMHPLNMCYSIMAAGMYDSHVDSSFMFSFLCLCFLDFP